MTLKIRVPLYWLLLFSANIFICLNINAQSDTVTQKNIVPFYDLSLEELTKVKVTTASKASELITDVPASVVVMNRYEIEQLGFQSFTEILEHITGIYYINEYFWLGSKNFGVRGFYSNGNFTNMIILVNGINQLSDKYSDYPDVKINVPVEAIERIEVIRGPMSVIYGSGAFFGAINIITKPSDNNYKNKVTTGYGSNNTFNSFFRYGDYSEKVKFGINIGYTQTSGIDVPFTDLTTQTDVIEYVGLSPDAKTGGQLDDSRTYADINLEYESFSAEINFAETKKDIFDGQPSYGNGSEMTTYATNIVLGYNKKLGKEWNLGAQTGFYNHTHHLDYTVFNDYYYEIDGQQTNSANIEVQANGKIGKMFNANVGVQERMVLSLMQISDFHYYGLDYGAGETGLPRGDKIFNGAVFSQIKFSPTNKIEFIAGLRLQHFGNYTMQYTKGIVSEDPDAMRDPSNPENRRIIISNYTPPNNGINLIPQLAFLYKPNQKSVIKLLYGQAVRQPSFSENYRQLPDDRPFLNASKIETYEINGLVNLTKKIHVNASVFYNYLDNLIVATNIYNQNTGEWDIYSLNSGKQNTKGAEFGVLLSPIKSMKINGSAMYQKSNNMKDGYENIELGYSPKLLIYGNISYLFPKNITASVLYKYIAKMQSTWVTETTPEEGSRLGAASPALNIVDANLRCTGLFNTGLFFNVKLRNIIGTEIRYPTTRSNAWMDKGGLGINRSILVNIGYDF